MDREKNWRHGPASSRLAVCPCTASGRKADYDRCIALGVFHVDLGEIEGTDVSGRTIGVLIDTPPNMLQGNWRSGLLIDDGASPEQVEKLGADFGGQKGGTGWGAVAPLIGEFLGVEQVPMRYSNDGSRHRVTMGPGIDMEVEDHTDEGMPGPQQLVGVAHPANTTLTIAVSKKGKISAFGIEVDNTDKSAFWAPFSWAG